METTMPFDPGTARPQFPKANGSITTEKFAHALGDAHKTAKGWRCRCPAHGDDQASLDVAPGKKWPFVFICRSQRCQQKSIIQALRALNLWPLWPERAERRLRLRPVKKSDLEAEWTPILPVPDGAPARLEGRDWSIVARFRDPDGHLHTEVIPYDSLAGEAVEVRALLMNRGLGIEPTRDRRAAFKVYLQGCKPSARATAAMQPGWLNDQIFVLPGGIYGWVPNEQAILRNPPPQHAFRVAGTLEDWRAGGGWIARCPAHQDGNPSLSIREGEGK